jgi:hypothetical protein
MSDRAEKPPPAVLHQGNLLNDRVRRDIADLNRLFLARALDPAHGLDPWFCLPLTAVDRLRAAAPEVLERAAQCPFSLFELWLPASDETWHWAGDAVADRHEGEPLDLARCETRRSFGVTALHLVRTLTEGVPMAPRIAFGLQAETEARLAGMSLSDSYRVAAWPGLIRPRWPGQDRYWSVFVETINRPEASHWAYASGLCLLGQCERQSPTVAYGARRPARLAHGRGRRKAEPDVPC